MNWKTTHFEREKLFDEVWAAPVTKLAKAYGLSDVGLRKICVALDVPLPPRGYWQKLAAGKKVPKPPLRETTVKTSYSRAMYVAQVDEALEERVANARAATLDAADSDTPDYSPPLDPTAFSQQAKPVVRAMKGTKLDEGALTSAGVTWADISVSTDLKERALQLVDRFAHELEYLGAEFENTHPPLPPLRRGARRESGIHVSNASSSRRACGGTVLTQVTGPHGGAQRWWQWRDTQDWTTNLNLFSITMQNAPAT